MGRDHYRKMLDLCIAYYDFMWWRIWRDAFSLTHFLRLQKVVGVPVCVFNGVLLLPAWLILELTCIIPSCLVFRYKLSQEHGDLINLHDWYQSFKSLVLRPSSSKRKSRQSPLPKKRKERNEPENHSEASIQYPLV